VKTLSRKRKGDWPLYPPEDTNAEHFDYLEYLRRFPAGALEYGSARRNLTRYNPLLFAILYFRKHLTDTNGDISFSDFHLESCRMAVDWARPVVRPKQYRTAVVAPRECGKSTWWFLILPMWAAAHGHVKFLAAYSDTSTQAERHLETFKRELETNALLGKDFNELGKPAVRRDTGKPLANNHEMIQTRNGFTFIAKGIDSSTLGLKVGNLRPDLIVLDDIEPGEANYSLAQKRKRLSTVQDVLFPMNLSARVAIAGTVVMEGSIIHDLVRTKTEPDDPVEEWVTDEDINVLYFPAIIEDGGTRRSVWPYKWSMGFLESIRHTRSFAKNFANQPISSDGTYWTEQSFMFNPTPPAPVATYMSVDPAVTGKVTSDYTGIAVVAYTPPQTRTAHEGLQGTATVKHASHVRLTPGPELRDHVLNILAQYPETIRIIIETNQGGDMWRSIFHDMPVQIETVHNKESKDLRAARLLTDYEAGHVLHTHHFPDLENEMLGYPLAHNDDLVDAVGNAVARIREQEAVRTRAPKKPRAIATHY